MPKLGTSLSVQYAESAGSPRVLIQLEPLISFNIEDIILRVYPPEVDKVVATGGTIRAYGSKLHRIEEDIITFNASDTGQGRYPITGQLRLRTLDAVFDSDGTAISPHFSADPDTGFIRSDQPCTGGVAADYDAYYREYRYTPGGRFREQTLESAAIMAFKDGTIAKLELDSSFLSTTNEYAELYRVVSDVVVDNQRRWEKPSGWPDGPTYSPLNTQPPDPDESLVELRTHEIAVISKKGRFQWDRPFWRSEFPYQADANYKPAWSYEQGTPPSGFEEAFEDFDFVERKSQLAKDWPGLAGL